MAAQVLKASNVVVRAGAVMGSVIDEDTHRVAVEAAYQAGLDDARAAAAAEREAAGPQVARAIEALVSATASAASAHTAALSRESVEVGIEVARWLSAREVEVDPNPMLQRVEQALAGLLPTAPPMLFVAPEMVEVIAAWAADASVEVRGRPGLAPGEAVLDAGHSSADLTFDAMADQVRAALAADLGACDQTDMSDQPDQADRTA